jgi:apolipoprotein N-acyltransferase
LKDTHGSTSVARIRQLLAIGAGLLLAAAFPRIGIAGFAWIAPGLMLAAALGTSGKESFRLGYIAGLAFWLASLYWLLLIPVAWFPILGWFALAAYLALFQGAWVWLCWKCFPGNLSRTGAPLPSEAGTSEGERPAGDCAPYPAGSGWRLLLAGFHGSHRLSRLRWALFCAALWVALEMIRARLLSGFPWSLLGSSQFEMTPLLQISSVTGVYGVSFLVTWTSVSLLCAGLMLFGPKARRALLAGEVLVPFFAVAVAFATGYHRITHVPEATRTLRLTTIQPSIPQTMIWDASANDQRFTDLLALSERALSNRTDALLWPEAALPELNEASFAAITNLAARHQVWFLFGADDVQLRPGATNEQDVIVFNGAWMLSPRGRIADNYHKRRLVIFGEYIPLADWLPFVRWLTPITGSFGVGTNAAQFELRDLGVRAAPLICFEDCFPHGAREHVTDETDLLVNLTNDGWFGDSAAQWQHAANAVFRAIENGVPLVRSCNNGLTCWIDPQGRVRDLFRDERGSVYGEGFATFTVPLPEGPHQNTFYRRHGDVFGWACVGIAGLAVASRARRGRGTEETRSAQRSLGKAEYGDT